MNQNVDHIKTLVTVLLVVTSCLLPWLGIPKIMDGSLMLGDWSKPLAQTLTASPLHLDERLLTRHIREITVTGDDKDIVAHVSSNDGTDRQLIDIQAGSPEFSHFPAYNFRLDVMKRITGGPGVLRASATADPAKRSTEQIASDISVAFDALSQSMDQGRDCEKRLEPLGGDDEPVWHEQCWTLRGASVHYGQGPSANDE